MTTKLLGHFGVDSGQVMIGDPCYLSTWEDNDFNDVRIYTKGKDTLQYMKDFSHYDEVMPKYGKCMNELVEEGWVLDEKHCKPLTEYSYNGACNTTIHNKNSGGELLNDIGAKLAVVSSTGYGDGVYPVHATYNKDGRIVKLTISFD